jgi:hypothetical protein
MSRAYLKQTLFIEQWDKLSLHECEEVARSLDELLPPTFRFHQVEVHTCGNHRHNVAFFEWSKGTPNHGNAFFALIPGDRPLLGYDREHPFVPTFEQHKNWSEETENEYGITLSQFLDTCMTPSRCVRIEPFLLEILATDLSQPRTYHEEWGMWVYEGKSIMHAEVLQYIHEDGFRFPSSDEWEHACAAGSRTLFRWGNETPNQNIPTIGHTKIANVDLHIRPNAFGLFIARNSYHWEFVEQAEIMRGGDGGNALHASRGTFATWLTLASPFYQAQNERAVREGTFSVHLRRAYSLF